MTNKILTFVLGALVVVGVILALQTINRSRELNTLQFQAVQVDQITARIQAFATETAAYDQKYPNPELTRILQGH